MQQVYVRKDICLCKKRHLFMSVESVEFYSNFNVLNEVDARNVI